MYIVIDVGATNTRIARTRDLVAFDEPVIFDTPEKYSEGLERIASTISGGENILGIVVGLPVLLSKDKRVIVDATNLPDWSGKPFAADMEQRCGAPVHLENDVTLVGLGEAVYGAGMGAEVVVYITVSTGVNGVRIVRGGTPETIGVSIGRQYVSMGEPQASWENLISGRAIEKQYGKHPKELGKDAPLWDTLARVTAYGVNNAIVYWTPDRVVLGGSMFNEIGIPVPKVQEYVREIWTATPEVPEIVHSSLGNLGGLWGGLARLKQLNSLSAT